MTNISSDKLLAYNGTDYVVEAPSGRIVSGEIGEPCPEIVAALQQRGLRSAAFITAYNPQGRACTDAANEAAHETLKGDLSNAGCQFWEGAGADPTGTWPPEKSLLALGIARHEAERLGRRWGQDAIVWVENDQLPELVLLR